ncbi:hypothetical protein T484DRAFT_1972529 [Baffinella frigidus]|nr:hypothetical protein T484DRAFT_1972529 [Cryptophyta sp. CCMP2293]
MSPTPNECVETVKEVMAEVMLEKDALVARLNAMNERIEEEKDLVAKVRLKVEWAEEKERSVKAMNTVVASLQCALAEEDASITHGSTVSREASDTNILKRTSRDAASRPRGASSQSFTHKHASSVDRDQDDFEMTIAKIEDDCSLEASQAGASKHRAPGSCPLRSQRPARLVANDGGEEPCGIVRRLSNEAAQIPQQVRRSLNWRVEKFSSSMLRRVGWDPALQESQRVWDYSI